MRTSQRKHRRGFTLFEVVLAVSIVVMLTAVMAETLSVSFNLKRAAERQVDAVRDTQSVGDVWAIDIANTVIPSPNSTVTATNGTTGTTSGTTSSTTATPTANTPNGLPLYLFGPFKGDAQNLSFYTTGDDPHAAVNSGVLYVEYGLESQPDGSTALVRRTATNLLADNPETPKSEPLVSHVQDLSFQYNDGTNTISDSWDSTVMTNALPYSVQMTLTLQPARQGDPPRVITRYASLVMAPAAAAAAGLTTSTTTSSNGNTTTVTGNGGNGGNGQ